MGGKQTKLQIWDTAGQERFRNITSYYYRGAHGVALVFDICSAKSFENIDSWIGEISLYGGGNVIKILIGNKADLTEKRTVSVDSAERYAESRGLTYYETSAKDYTTIETVF